MNLQVETPEDKDELIATLTHQVLNLRANLTPPKRKQLAGDLLTVLANEHLKYQEESYEVSGVFAFARAIEKAHGIG